MRRLFVLIAVLTAACSRQKPLPVYGQVPAFELTNQQGRTFDRSHLDGHVWVADFIYTNCEGPCPRMTSRMHAMVPKMPSDVQFVSFTVDPQRDTPAALSEYSKKFDADASRWTFLTGPISTLDTLDHDAFMLGNVGAGMDHSTRFVLVDKKGRVRGYYGLTEDGLLNHIAKDAERLNQEQG